MYIYYSIPSSMNAMWSKPSYRLRDDVIIKPEPRNLCKSSFKMPVTVGRLQPKPKKLKNIL
jgi:hypothetical protein